MSNEQNQEQQNKDGKKVRQKYEANLNLFMSILENRDKGQLIKKDKIPNDKLDGVLEKILEKRTKAAEEAFMTEFDTLTDEMLKFNRFCEQKEKEKQKAVEEEMKKMNAKFEALFNRFQDINTLRKEVKKAVTTLLSGSSQLPEETDEDKTDGGDANTTDDRTD